MFGMDTANETTSIFFGVVESESDFIPSSADEDAADLAILMLLSCSTGREKAYRVYVLLSVFYLLSSILLQSGTV